MFGAILTSMWSMIQSFGFNLSNVFKCESYFCNKVVYNNPSRCNAFGDIYNRLTRELTPSVESPTRRTFRIFHTKELKSNLTTIRLTIIRLALSAFAL